MPLKHPKRERFAEIQQYEHVLLPGMDEIFAQDYQFKGNWAAFFGNDHPLTLELGCGRGEYTVGLARQNPQGNYLGFDIKGARIWRGARNSLREGLRNVGFIRARAEFLLSFFAPGDVAELWLTFPDPCPGKPRKCLTSAIFLPRFARILKPNALIHLKTDNFELFQGTIETAKAFGCQIRYAVENIYQWPEADSALTSIQTYYEKMFAGQGFSIKYVQFCLPEFPDGFPPLKGPR